MVILEQESHAGYHSTGRSGAMFMESYGSAQVRALTTASRAFYERPDWAFESHPILLPRGALIVAAPQQAHSLEAAWNALRVQSAGFERLDAARTCARIPVMRQDKVMGAILDGGAADMDVNELHQGFLRGLRSRNGITLFDRRVDAIERTGEYWEVWSADECVRAPVIVNAAGAWCDDLARMAGVRPIGLVPKRRSAFMFAAPEQVDITGWPMCLDIDEKWYFKPDAKMLLGSPANADPVDPQDVQAEELDIAMGIYQIEEMTTIEIRRPARVWAGLRSFVADGDLVGGFDGDAPGFFWVAAQGGYGIQTAAAMGEACAAVASGKAFPRRIADFGLTPAALSPGRLR